jgi:hypothetical protein
MRRIVHIALLGALLGFVGLMTAYAQSTPDLTTIDKVGWWTRRPGAMAYGNPNNFEVAAGAQGDESIAALRVLIRGSVTKATFVMPEADAPLSSLNPGKLRVCTTNVPWLVTDGGAFADAPKPDCGAAVELKRTADATGVGTWTGDVTSMVAGSRSEVTLMVVPSPDSAAVVPPTYYMKLAARIDAQGTPDTPTSPLVSPPTPTVSQITPAAPRVTTPGAVVTAPAASTPTTTAAAPATPSSTPSRFKLAAQSKEQKHWGRLIWLLPLAAIFSALYTGGRLYWAQRLGEATTT